MNALYKVIRTDNYARETVADKLIEENLTEEAAVRLCEEKRAQSGDDEAWYLVVPQNYRLWGGMEELV